MFFNWKFMCPKQYFVHYEDIFKNVFIYIL